MNKSEIQNRINGLNEFMLSDSTKKLVLLKISNDYTYNKAVALIDKDFKSTDWYAIDDKCCFKTWNEVEAYIDGICKAKNTNFNEERSR